MRHDDQSNPKIISHKVRCYNCQRPAQAEKKHSMALSLEKNIVGIYRSKKKPHVTQMMEKFTM